MLREAAELGYAPAECMIGVAYKYGLGVTQDYGRAVEWWKKAAAQSNTLAHVSLGQCHAKGKGVSQDYAKAIQMLKEVADEGAVAGQGALAWVYATCKDPKYHDGNKAVEYATKAVSQEPKRSHLVGTLSAAYARNGQFDEAIANVERAVVLAQDEKEFVPGSKKKQLATLARMPESFRKHQPYIDADTDD